MHYKKDLFWMYAKFQGISEIVQKDATTFKHDS